MYSVILAAALSTAGSAPQWHGSWAYSGYGGCGCYGCYGCSGCYGGGGGGWGCWGSYGYYSWGGCYGGYGPGAAYALYGNYNYCSGCYGGAAIYCSGGYGCYGGWSGYGPVLPGTPTTPTNPGMKLEEAPVPKGKSKAEIKEDQVSRSQPRASVIIEVPADAKVYIDGQLTKATSTRRVFHTPVLKEGLTYFYDIRADVVREGRTISQSQRVILNPGQRVVAAFSDLERNTPATARSEEE